MGSLLSGAFQAYGKIKYQAIGTIIYSFVMLILVLIAIHLNLGLIFIACCYALSYFAMLIYLSINDCDG